MFRAQDIHSYVIQVIVSYTEAFLVKSDNTLHTFRKGRSIQGIQIPPRDFLIITFPDNGKLRDQVVTILISVLLLSVYGNQAIRSQNK